MTVELYVVLSICIILCIYLNKSDKEDQKKKEYEKRATYHPQKTLEEIKDMYFDSLRELDEMYRDFQKRNS